MKVSKALEGVVINKLHGNEIHPFFTGFDLKELHLLMQWILEIENAQYQTVEIDMRHAPEWLCELIKGNKINAIKAVRDHLPHVVTYELNISAKEGYKFLPNLKPTKDFVEAMEECIVAPSRPLLTSA